MRVSFLTATRLDCVKSVLKKEVKKDERGNDVRGVYERIVNFLAICANQGEDIAIARGYSGRIPCYNGEDIRERNRSRFTPEVVEEVALNQFSRYSVYELGAITCPDIFPLLKRQIGEYAEKMSLELSVKKAKEFGGWNHAFLSYQEGLGCWYSALDKVAEKVSYHWGTPLESVE
jgi:hypothetical protein